MAVSDQSAPIFEARALAVVDRIERLRTSVTAADGWRRAAAAVLAGAVSVLAFAPFFLWPVLFLTMPILVWLIDGSVIEGQTPRRDGSDKIENATTRGLTPARSAGLAGWWFGFGYFLLGLFWIGEAFLVEADKFAWLMPFAITLLPAGLALFFAAAAAGARCFWHPGLERVLVLALALSATEWLRGHVLTGFPWNVLGYALTYPLPMMQSAGLFGVYGLTLIAVIVFAAPLVLASDAVPGEARGRGAWRGVAIAAVPLLLMFGYGALRLAAGPAPMLDGVRIRIVQPSIPQREKWLPEKQGPIFQEHLDLSRHNASGQRDDLKGISHVVWPEAAMPFRPLEHPEAISAIGELVSSSAYLLSGGLRVVTPVDGGDRHAYNSLMAFGPGGGLAALYDKIHLVPFGEYLPFQKTLEAIGIEQLTQMRGGFSTGLEPRPLLSAGALPRFGALICYEAIFPGAVVQGAERPGLFVNITNDGWFGNTTGPRQHFHQARVRAVEEGIPLLRAANNGISGMIDAEGRVVVSLGLNERGVIDTDVPQTRPPTVYARLGDWCLVAEVMAIAFLLQRLTRRRRSA